MDHLLFDVFHRWLEQKRPQAYLLTSNMGKSGPRKKNAELTESCWEMGKCIKPLQLNYDNTSGPTT